MSNLGLRLAMAERGIDVVETPGRRPHVIDALERDGLTLGGEQSGHLVFRERARPATASSPACSSLDARRAARPAGRARRRAAGAGAPGARQRRRRRPGRRGERDERLGRGGGGGRVELGDQRPGGAAGQGTEPWSGSWSRRPTRTQAARGSSAGCARRASPSVGSPAATRA